MLDHIFRLVRDFELEHGVPPNLLYLNRVHSQYLKSGFAEDYSMQQIMQLLHMELVIENEIMHPHVAWTQTAQERWAS